MDIEQQETRHDGEKLLVPLNTQKETDSGLYCIQTCQQYSTSCCTKHLSVIQIGAALGLILGFTVYIGFVIARSQSGRELLIVLSAIAAFFTIYELIKPTLGRILSRYQYQIRNISGTWHSVWRKLRWVLCPFILTGVMVYLTLIVIKTKAQACALLGYCVFISIALVTSNAVTKVRWRPVLVGLAAQVVIAIFVLRCKLGYSMADWLGQKVTALLQKSLRGSTTAFGDPTAFLHPFLMVVTPVIIYISALSAFFTHVGVIPYLSRKIAWLMHYTLGTSHIESVSISDGFLSGMMDYSTDFKPYIPHLTPSELLTTIVGAHCNLSGFMYGLFMIFWVKPQDLMMSALIGLPAGIALSKLNFPETYHSHCKSHKSTKYNRRGDRNIFEVTALGAWHGGKVVAAILVQIMAFVAMYEFFDTILIWLGQLVQIKLSFRVLFSYLFCPFGYLIGLAHEEIFDGSYPVGLYMVQNEVIAYLEMGAFRMQESLTRRTIAIATSAISAFSSFSSMTLVMGAWSKASPKCYRQGVTCLYRTYLLTKLASLMTGSLVGIFYDEELIGRFDRELAISDNWIHVGRILQLLPSYKTLLSWLGIQV